MTSSERRSLSAAARFFNKRAAIAYKCGHVATGGKYAKWSKLIQAALAMIPQCCRGCAYEKEQNGRCVGCRRVANRVDNYRSKYV